MPPLERMMLHQDAVLWEYAGDADDGTPKVSAPIAIKCRWEESTSEGVNANGGPITYSGELFVCRDVPEDSILFLGCYDDTVGTGTGFVLDDNLHIVRKTTKVPDIKGRSPVRKLSLQRYTKTLPTVV